MRCTTSHECTPVAGSSTGWSRASSGTKRPAPCPLRWSSAHRALLRWHRLGCLRLALLFPFEWCECEADLFFEVVLVVGVDDPAVTPGEAFELLLFALLEGRPGGLDVMGKRGLLALDRNEDQTVHGERQEEVVVPVRSFAFRDIDRG